VRGKDGDQPGQRHPLHGEHPHDAVVLAGRLRDATAVAAAAVRAAEGPIGVVPAGERWHDRALRVAAEDARGVGRCRRGPGRCNERPGALSRGRARRGRSSPPPRAACPFPALASCRELIADGYAAAWTWPPPTTSTLPPRGSSTAS